MKNKIVASVKVLSLIFLLTPMSANAQAKKAFHPKVDKGAMRAAKSNLNSMLSVLIEGDFESVAAKANKMQQKSLIKKVSVLQEDDQNQTTKFLEINTEYEQGVKKITEAAKKKSEGEVFKQYIAVIQSCMKCHALYAKHRFPKFHQ